MQLLKRVLRFKSVLLVLLAVMITANAQNAKYVDKHKELVSNLSQKYGIPEKVIMAVAIVESSSGLGQAAKLFNNHFGMMGAKKTVVKGHKSSLKKYDNDEASFVDFCLYVTRRKFYGDLKDTQDPEAWVKELSKAGYSSKPQVWQKRILTTINQSKL